MNSDTRHQPLGRMPMLVIALTVVIFAAAIWLVTAHVRSQIRDQIIRRDGEILNAVAMMLQMEEAEETAGSTADDQVNQFNVLLKTSRMKWVVATRLFDARGKFVAAFPVYVADAGLKDEYLEDLQRLQPIDRFYPSARLDDIFLKNSAVPGDWNHTVPLLEVVIPLHARNQSRLLGVAQFIIDGQSIAAEFAALDRNLYLQAIIIFFTGSLLLAVSLNWAFGRLIRARQQLRERTKSLLEANQELALATKTSAIGAVSTHLLHELKSQIFGLQGFLSYPGASSGASDSQRQTALDTTRRIQGLINQMLDVIRNEQGTTRHYEISLNELAEIVSREVEPAANNAEVKFTVEVQAQGTLSSRVANLVIIILMNLIQNGIQATPRKKQVHLALTLVNERIECRVRDEGPGFPKQLLPTLFKPGPSTKEGGSGIGLALSKQLAGHLGAELELKENTPSGCLFVLTIPNKLIAGKTVLAS